MIIESLWMMGSDPQEFLSFRIRNFVFNSIGSKTPLFAHKHVTLVRLSFHVTVFKPFKNSSR